LDQEIYERRFLEAPGTWAGYDKFSVQITVMEDMNDNLFYYCIIHKGMEGPIKVLRSGGLEETAAAASTGSSVATSIATTFVDTRSEFDKRCGTFGLGDFQLPNPYCPDRFICGTEEVSNELQQFAECLDAANCFMMSGMTTGIKATADTALFVHQMIPHHENAVNTAKTLLKTGNLLCPDLSKLC